MRDLMFFFFFIVCALTDPVHCTYIVGMWSRGRENRKFPLRPALFRSDVAAGPEDVVSSRKCAVLSRKRAPFYGSIFVVGLTVWILLSLTLTSCDGSCLERFRLLRIWVSIAS